jgi:hypothetical protein
MYSLGRTFSWSNKRDLFNIFTYIIINYIEKNNVRSYCKKITLNHGPYEIITGKKFTYYIMLP